ncbi:AHH domain-containing protein [Myxococcus eversor]|uniref:AHH domain-containing protein n=1 Tax=Myxococcus eversor TaxID=2709661 RepID=UPI0013D2B826|nr:AHH domain-containing protein [Myxococcus eversor]
MAENNHLTDEDTGLHKPIGNALEGGACLSGHESDYHKKNSCSYRYQAVEHSRSNKGRGDIYKVSADGHARIAQAHGGGPIPTSRYLTRRGSSPENPSGRYPWDGDYGDHLTVPQPGDWDINGPTRVGAVDAAGKPIGPGMNFTTSFWPYWNNAHHMIPKGTLNTAIANADTDPRIVNLIRAGLLKAPYNVNHYVNMILLPMDTEVGKILNLPRHLSLDDGSTAFDQKPKFDHIPYNHKVATRLKAIMSDYKERAAEIKGENQDCDIKKMTPLSKRKLHTLSNDCYKAITDFGSSNPGEPLVDLPGLKLS